MTSKIVGGLSNGSNYFVEPKMNIQFLYTTQETILFRVQTINLMHCVGDHIIEFVESEIYSRIFQYSQFWSKLPK